MRPLSADDLACALVELDAAGRVRDANLLFEEWTGRTRSELVGRSLDSLIVLTRSGDGMQAVTRVEHVDGSRRAVLDSRSPLPDGELVVLLDATERVAFEERLARSHSLEERTRTRLELVIEASIAFATATTETELAEILSTTVARAYRAEQAAVFLLHEEGSFQQAAGENPLEESVGTRTVAAQAALLRRVLLISGAEEAEAVSPVVARAFRETGVQALLVSPIRHDDELFGVFVCYFLHPRTFDNEAAPLADALSGQAGQTATTLRLQRQLEHAAMHDETTGLANRRQLEARLLDYSRSAPALIAVLFIDLDGFKGVNDGLGHHIGDLLLREVGERIRSVVRQQDFVSRYGGDEFVVVCEVPDEAAAADVGERIRVALESPVEGLAATVRISASIGLSVAGAEEPGWNPELLVRRADHAMYAAKEAGGNRVVDARQLGDDDGRVAEAG